jgi:hypothetical protein
MGIQSAITPEATFINIKKVEDYCNWLSTGLESGFFEWIGQDINMDYLVFHLKAMNLYKGGLVEE